MVGRRIALLAAVALLATAGSAHAAFPGQNGKIAYSHFNCGATGCTQGLYTTFEDGTGRVQLTTGARDAWPAWSADGSKIAFSSNRDEPNPSSCGAQCNYEIYSMNADGTGRVRLTSDPASDYSPAWSPDGSKIAFNSSRSPSGIYVMNADGSDPRLLLAGVRDPAWSPDGTKIAYTGPGGESDQLYASEIWTMDADGTDQRRITQSGDIEYPCGSSYFTYDEADFGPNWSPDGTKLVYAEELGDLCGDGDFAYAVETVDATGGGPEHTIFSSYEGCGFPSTAWSPDGSRIAFTYCYLYGANPDGSDRRFIDSTCCGIDDADWQPIANRPPDCSGVTATPNLLWPPDRRFRTVELAGASDPDGDEVTLEITGVTQDEPVGGGRDAYGLGDNLARLRTERDPRGDGRVYRIAFTVTDAEGAQCEGTANVSVPRKRKQPAVDSAPPSYDSFGG
jgi:Tol biopolymer transport system component